MNNDYLINKKPFYALLIFSFPIIIGNLFQQLYTIVDSAIVGRFVGETALAAVGASYALTNIFVCVAVGGSVGASVIVSHHFGAKEYNKMKLAIYTAMIIFGILSILLAVFGFFFSAAILRFLGTPESAFTMAVLYLKIYFIGLPFLFMYNVISSMFNALGKSRFPLGFLIFSSLFNTILDILLVNKYHMGVAGVAWATVIAQGISMLLSLAVFLKILHSLCNEHSSLFNQKEASSMIRVALPSILQQSTVSIGMMMVQSVVNSFGAETLAGFSAAMRIESLCVVPMSGIGNSISLYTAQNIGAKKRQRVLQGLHAAISIIVASAVLIFVILEAYNRQIIMLFLGNNGSNLSISTGRNYLKFMGIFFVLLGLKMAIDGVLRGCGDMKVFTIASMVNLFIRVSIAMIFAPKYGIQIVWYAVPCGWLANLIISGFRYRYHIHKVEDIS